MLYLILWVLGFLLEDTNNLGAQMINGFEMILILLYIVAGVLSILFIFTSLVTGAAVADLKNSQTAKILFIFAGSSAITFMGLFRIGIIIALLNYIVRTMDPKVQSFSEISDSTLLAIGIYVVYLIIIIIKKKDKVVKFKKHKEKIIKLKKEEIIDIDMIIKSARK